MTDFAGAFHEGQAAASRAQIAREEIRTVFAALSRQLLAATDGRLNVAIGTPANTLAKWMDLAAGVSKALKPPGAAEDPQVRWICGCNPRAVDASMRAVALWHQPSEGYPCIITVQNTELRCHDRESLEEALLSMLRMAWVAEQLTELVNRPVKDSQRPDANPSSNDALPPGGGASSE
jgi:hypothetical protein